jgi:predicted nucleic acid-binding protein
MYLVDTDVISEARKGDKANPGVKAFFERVGRDDISVYLSVITIGELRQGVEKIRHRKDMAQAQQLERWLRRVTTEYADSILSFDEDMAHVWGRLRAPNTENPLDKQIAATALINDLTVVTRNDAHYEPTGVRILNPFT